jgi:geranylgeranyl diphosphate synthase type II
MICPAWTMTTYVAVGQPTTKSSATESPSSAGDALLTVAFNILAQSRPNKRYDVATQIRELARAAGSLHLIGGQVADLEGEGKPLTGRDLRYIHSSKTAALLTTSIRLGAMSANASPAQLKGATEFGQALGLAFQVIDDILDVTQTTEKLGKTAGKDVKATKATFPAIYGLEKSRSEARKLTVRARAALKPFGSKGEHLRQLADYLLAREY